MNATIILVTQSLDELSQAVLQSSKEDRVLTELVGWPVPPLSRKEFAFMITEISKKFKNSNIDIIDPDLEENLKNIPAKVDQFRDLTLPQLLNSNGHHATAALTSFMFWLTAITDPFFDWGFQYQKGALPKDLTRRLRSIKDELDALAPEKDKLETQIKTINDAYEAAELLPTDLKSLREAKAAIRVIQSDSAAMFGKIEQYHKEIEKWTKEINDQKNEAEKLVEQCEQAYRITTTKGLAAAFELREKKLTNSVWGWVAGLIVALVVGGWIGSTRFTILSQSLTSNNLHWGAIWMQFSLSIISFAAPLWFAWLSTKQIAQRFRLAEDYAFKASVAKAYEGYRKEAARLDEKFESRLFSAALERLEEAPLRLIEQENHGSPYQEFFNSKPFQTALKNFPDLKDKFFNLATQIVTKKSRQPEENQLIVNSKTITEEMEEKDREN